MLKILQVLKFFAGAQDFIQLLKILYSCSNFFTGAQHYNLYSCLQCYTAAKIYELLIINEVFQLPVRMKGAKSRVHLPLIRFLTPTYMTNLISRS